MNKLFNRIQSPTRWLLLASLFSCLLLAFRSHWILGEFPDVETLLNWFFNFRNMVFLAWNLGLAWIPFCLASWISGMPPKKENAAFLSLGMLGFFFFFPNAPYIITDLIHIHSHPIIPRWFDAMMICSFAWTGLMLAYQGLAKIHYYLAFYLGKTAAWSWTTLCIAAGSFGIFLGRFLRWNTWDILFNPVALVRDILNTLTGNGPYLESIHIVWIFTCFLLIVFGFLNSFQKGAFTK